MSFFNVLILINLLINLIIWLLRKIDNFLLKLQGILNQIKILFI